MTKECKKCRQVKPLDQFQPGPTKSGYRANCRDCWNLYMKEYYLRNPDKYTKQKEFVQRNDKKYKRAVSQHHLTDETLSAMIESSEGKCWACGDRAWQCIDHDHRCCPGRYSCGTCVRGLLCNGCNSALGHARDDVIVLQSLIRYLGR